MFRQLRPAIMSLFLLTIITGLAYPMLITGIAQIIFPNQANGSLIQKDGHTLGSHLIGQPFDDPRYFWSRPSATSATSDFPLPSYNAANSSGSNLSPTNPALIDAIKTRITTLQNADPTNTRPIPVDLITASGSGLDPHISIAAAEYQVPRIARLRKIAENDLQQLIATHTSQRDFGLLGEARVNVLELNLALDQPSNLKSGGK